MARRAGEGAFAGAEESKKARGKPQAYADLMERLKRKWMERGEGMEKSGVCVAGGAVREKKEITDTCMN